MMTAKQLIEKLKTFSDDDEVYILGHAGYSKVEEVCYAFASEETIKESSILFFDEVHISVTDTGQKKIIVISE